MHVNDYDPHRMLAELSPWEEATAEMDRIAAEFADRRFTGRSSSGFVSAEVDGNGVLLDITVSDDALRQAHPANIGPDTVEAITNARNASGMDAMARMNQVAGVKIG